MLGSFSGGVKDLKVQEENKYFKFQQISFAAFSNTLNTLMFLVGRQNIKQTTKLIASIKRKISSSKAKNEMRFIVNYVEIFCFVIFRHDLSYKLNSVQYSVFYH